MIVYGSKAVLIEAEKLTNVVCPSCRKQGSMVMNIYSKHAHVFWIPMFPIGKKGISECQHCKNVLEVKEMPEYLKSEYELLKNKLKGPVWQYAGLILLTAIIFWGIYAAKEDGKLELEYVNTPLIGDVYEYKVEFGGYSTLKVINVSNDSVFVLQNEFETNKRRKIYKIDKPENYSKSAYGISKDQLKEMYTSGNIVDINR